MSNLAIMAIIFVCSFFSIFRTKHRLFDVTLWGSSLIRTPETGAARAHNSHLLRQNVINILSGWQPCSVPYFSIYCPSKLPRRPSLGPSFYYSSSLLGGKLREVLKGISSIYHITCCTLQCTKQSIIEFCQRWRKRTLILSPQNAFLARRKLGFAKVQK